MIALTRNERRALLVLGSFLLIGGLVRGLRGPPALSWDEGPAESKGMEMEEGSTGPLSVDPNHADRHELQALPGIGPVLAEAIIRSREQIGPFSDPSTLLRVPGIGPKRLEQLRPYLNLPQGSGAGRVGGEPHTGGRNRIDLNRVGMTELLGLPEVGSTLATRILTLRELRGEFRSVEDLRLVEGLSEERLERLRLLLWVDFDTALGSR